jgi:DNA transformation protein
MVASTEYAEFLREQLTPLGANRDAPHVWKDRCILRCSDAGRKHPQSSGRRRNRAAFEEARTSPPLNYAKGGKLIDSAFWRVPDRLFDDAEEFINWARLALAAAHRVAAKRKP